MTAINLPRETLVPYAAAANVCSVAGSQADDNGEALTFSMALTRNGTNCCFENASGTNSMHDPRDSHLDRRDEKDMNGIVHPAPLSPVHSYILGDTVSDVANADASHESRPGRTQAEQTEEISAETFVPVPPEISKNDAECEGPKFEGRVTRLARKRQLEGTIETFAKRHPTSRATYNGRIKDSLDAGIVIEACIKGILRKVSAAMEVSSIEIRSGTVFVIDEGDGNIQRWRDGYQWSPSRISGGFLIYRQVETNDIVPSTEAGETQNIPADGSKLTKGKSFTVLPDGLTKKTIGMIGSDRQSYRVISYYETEEANVRGSLINIRELDSPRISAHKALSRPSTDELFASLRLYPKDTCTSNDWRNKRRRRAVEIPQFDRRYPEYEPQMSDYPIMFPYRNDPAGATDDSHTTPSTTEILVHRDVFSNEQSSSSQQQRTPSTLAPKYSRPIAMEQYLNIPAHPIVAYTPSSSSNTLHYHGNTQQYSLFAHYDAYQCMTSGFISQQQQYQQQYTLGPGYFQPPSGYGPLPPPSNQHYPLWRQHY
ncbi:hypothetical protein HDU81_010901 [Chytriomyces hyalinus]|nr:hypothetical protein HDU81_010901 [Chytriomyces hyalinus]